MTLLSWIRSAHIYALCDLTTYIAGLEAYQTSLVDCTAELPPECCLLRALVLAVDSKRKGSPILLYPGPTCEHAYISICGYWPQKYSVRTRTSP